MQAREPTIKETSMNALTLFQNQLLATKFYVPVPLHPLISRPRLTTLLDESLKRPLTLISAPAGFGKTTLLAAWAQAPPASHPRLSWVSLDEEDNEPQLFWTTILTALEMHQPGYLTPLLTHFQSSQAPPLKYVLTALINLLADRQEHFLLILDDYHLITEQQVHTTLSYLIEHLPPQLHIILATRADPPLSLVQLRARRQVLEVRTDQLRCTAEETMTLFQSTMGITWPEETIKQVTVRTEGWLVGLQLLALSLPEQANPLTLLEDASGSQRYILDYLTDEVLRRQPQEVQTFLLCTSILQRLNASLCNTVTQQTDSQHMLERLEQANLFVTSLDSKHQWYRYHTLFAEALCYRLEQTHADLVPALHYRASLWYAQHDQTTEAVLHAFSAHQWQWAADLIERIPMAVLTWGAGEHALFRLREWLEQLPAEVVRSRPHLCLASAQLLWAVAPPTKLQVWLDTAEATLTALLTQRPHEDTPHTIPSWEAQQQQEDLLGEVIAFRAFLQNTQEDGKAVLALCQRALTLLSPQNLVVRVLVITAQSVAAYLSSANDAKAAVQSTLQAVSLAQTAGQPSVAISAMGTIALYMMGTGQLHEAQQLTQQAMKLGTLPEGLVLPDVGWPALFQADILREWDQLDAALDLVLEAISLCKQTASAASLIYSLHAYAVLLRISLSRGELDAAGSAIQQVERIGMSLNQTSIYHRSFFGTVDQIRFWIACGELDCATQWAEKLDLAGQHGTPFEREREVVAHVRILLAKNQPDLALQRLEPVLQRATTGQRWGHVIEIRLLQALAHQMCNEEVQTLDTLSEAVRLAEPEGYIRSFMDEGAPMAALLSRLREHQHKDGPTFYLDRLLAAFQQESRGQEPQLQRGAGHPTAQPLQDPLSEREREVLQLLARGASNLEIAQELVIVVDTVKRHVSHIFSKLAVKNRVQAVKQARALGLLDEEL